MRLIADSFMAGKYRKPRVSLETLERWNEGVIVLQSCLGGIVSQMLSTNRDEEAEQWAKNFKEIFGDRYYLELTYTGLILAP